MWSHKHNCERCSHYLEHLLLGAHVGELQAHPTELEQWLDHAWPTAMDDICKAVAQPLQERLDVAGNFCNIKDDEITWLQLVNVDLREDLAAERMGPALSRRQAQPPQGQTKRGVGGVGGSPVVA